MSEAVEEQGVGSELPVEVSMVTEISSETVDLLNPHNRYAHEHTHTHARTHTYIHTHAYYTLLVDCIISYYSGDSVLNSEVVRTQPNDIITQPM